MRTLIGFLSAVFFAGCSATYQQQIVRAPTAKLERDKGVFISTPKDGWYGKIEYKNSGKMTAAAIKAAFFRYSNNVYVSEECLGLECLKIIPRAKLAYYVEPEILYWEDRAPEWSAIPNKITVEISVHDVALGSGIAATVIHGESKLATFGGDHPQDLLPEPVNQYVASLY